MTEDFRDLDALQNAYKDALEQWIAAIRKEEALVCVDHSIAEVDRWEQAHFDEEDARGTAKSAKKVYEDALREKFFGF